MKILNGWKKYGECEKGNLRFIHLAWKNGVRINLSLNEGKIKKDWTVTHFPERCSHTEFFRKTFKRKSSAVKFAERFMAEHKKLSEPEK